MRVLRWKTGRWTASAACFALAVASGCPQIGQPADDDTTSADDDSTAVGDDDSTPGDDDSTPGDDDSTPGDDDSSGDDDDLTPANPWNWVVGSVEVAGLLQSVDIDGDGNGDNAIFPLKSVLDPIFVASLAASPTVSVVQIALLEDWTEDPDIAVGLFVASDPDGDPTDNLSGSEVFDAGLAIDTTGLAVLRTPTLLTGGHYGVDLGSGSLEVGSMTLELATGLFLDGLPTTTIHNGRMAFGVDVAVLTLALTTAGVPSTTVALISNLADIDSDGNGSDDAVSVTLVFSAMVCEVQ